MLRTSLAAAGGLATFLVPAVAAMPFMRPSGSVRGQVPSASNSRSALRSPAPWIHLATAADSTYAGGKVVFIDGDAVILESDAEIRAVVVSGDAVVWKEFETGRDAIQLGDWLDVKGIPDKAGVLHATSGWIFVNIGRRDGEIVERSDGRIIIRNGGRTATIELSQHLEVIEARDQTPVTGGTDGLAIGTRIGAVGLRLPNGDLRATRIWR
jgi:hypothetical protein